MQGVFNIILRHAMARILNMGVRKATNAYARRTGDATSKGPQTAAGRKARADMMKRIGRSTWLGR